MICGVDANVLIYSAVESMPEHRAVYSFFEDRMLTGEFSCAVTFQVLLEFIHITTDPKRFKPPLTIEESLELAEQYWNAANWHRLVPKSTTGSLAIDLLRKHKLGRKRLLDTYFVATLMDHGITAVISCNGADFKVFDSLRVIDPLKGRQKS